MQVLFCGSRKWKNLEIIYDVLSTLPADAVVLHCQAAGADQLVGSIAKKMGFNVKPLKHIDETDVSDTPTRALQMLAENPDLVIAFHADIASSIGTKHILTEARKRKIPVKLVTSSRPDLSP